MFRAELSPTFDKQANQRFARSNYYSACADHLLDKRNCDRLWSYCWVILPMLIQMLWMQTKYFSNFRLMSVILTWVERLLEVFRSAILVASQNSGVWNRFRWNQGNQCCQTMLPPSCQLSKWQSDQEGGKSSQREPRATSGWGAGASRCNRSGLTRAMVGGGGQCAGGKLRQPYLPGQLARLMPLPLCYAKHYAAAESEKKLPSIFWLTLFVSDHCKGIKFLASC